jgi:hypothetical protein
MSSSREKGAEDDWFNVPIFDYQYWTWTLQCKFDIDNHVLCYRYKAPGMVDWWEGQIDKGTIELVRKSFSAWADYRVRSLPQKSGKNRKRLIKVTVKEAPSSSKKSKVKKTVSK